MTPARRSPARTKRFGQNFLIAQNVSTRIVALANLDPSRDIVLEIGPGRGSLTRLLAQHAKTVVAIEIDPQMAGETRAACMDCSNLIVIEGDILAVEWPACTKIVANLPYSISSPVTFKLISAWDQWEEAVLMYQKEFADRLFALPGSSKYSRLSAGVQYFLTVEKLMTVSRRNFNPQPSVDSVVVHIQKKDPAPPVPPDLYLTTTRYLFPFKNKTMRHAVTLMLKNQQQERDHSEIELALGNYATRRVRTLAPLELADLAVKFHELQWI